MPQTHYAKDGINHIKRAVATDEGSLGFNLTILIETGEETGSPGLVCNLAARLCAEAKDGQILVAQRVAVSVEATTPLEEIGELTVKRLTQPVAAHNVPLAATQPALRVIEAGPQSV